MRTLFTIIITSLLLCACNSQSSVTRSSLYPKMYEEKPGTILIMPPINNTNHAEAKDYFYSSMYVPLCEKGYYVISPFLAMDLFKQESAYDSEMFINGKLDVFRRFFDADAVMFTTINGWEKQSGLNYIKVDIRYTLKSANTNEILFERNGELTVDFTSGNNGLLGMVLDMVNTAITDKIVAARRCNYFILRDLPAGKYSANFDKDQDTPAGSKDFKGRVSY